MLRLAIDASRVRSGGAVAHLQGILSASSPRKYGIEEVHLFAPYGLQSLIPSASWIVKHSPDEINGTLLSQLLWQAKKLPRELDRLSCDLLFAVDASTVCKWQPLVVLSQDMLSFEPGIMQQFGWSKARLRLLAIKHIQCRAMSRAAGVIFLTKYAANTIQRSCRSVKKFAIIPHGVDPVFREIEYVDRLGSDSTVVCTYVSNMALYKNQWVVVKAISNIRKKGIDVRLLLVGGGRGAALSRTRSAIAEAAEEGEFTTMYDFVSRTNLVEHLRRTDIFVFASSCENMPVTLLEGMAAGLPIACSDRGPMPEVLGHNGVFFDPTCAESVASAIEQLIEGRQLRNLLADSARRSSDQFTWRRCAERTWRFLAGASD